MAILNSGARSASWALLGAAMGVGCLGVALRADGSPAEEKCPTGAAEAMASFNLAPGNSLIVDVDVTQRNMSPLIVYDGPVESETWLNENDFPGKSRLYGRIWTGGPRVTIRYYSARLPDGRIIPFCAMAGEDEGPGLPKSPGRPGSAALAHSDAAVYVVRRFR